MDVVRSQFYWRNCEKFKYHMVKWKNVSSERTMGCVGILNTRML